MVRGLSANSPRQLVPQKAGWRGKPQGHGTHFNNIICPRCLEKRASARLADEIVLGEYLEEV